MAEDIIRLKTKIIDSNTFLNIAFFSVTKIQAWDELNLREQRSRLPFGIPASTFAKVAPRPCAAHSVSEKPTQKVLCIVFLFALALRGVQAPRTLQRSAGNPGREGLAGWQAGGGRDRHSINTYRYADIYSSESGQPRYLQPGPERPPGRTISHNGRPHEG